MQRGYVDFYPGQEDAGGRCQGPQIRHMLGDVKKVVNGKCPVEVIDMRDYGMIRGDKVLDKALKLVGKE